MKFLVLAALLVAANARVAPFNLADGDFPQRYGCGCVHKGNLFYPVLNDGCRSFTQQTEKLRAAVRSCPPGLLFNKDACACDRARNVDCSCNDPLAANDAPKICPSQQCEAQGNLYRPVSGCRNFTQETAFLKAVLLSCPGDQLFDIKTCVCHHPDSVTCPC